MRHTVAVGLRRLADWLALETCEECGTGIATSAGTPICSYCYSRQVKEEAQETVRGYLTRKRRRTLDE